MKTIEIKGRPYVAVNERIKYFRENFAGYSLITEIIDISDSRVIMKAKVINPDGVVISDGIAYEDAGSTYINKTSYIENCQTSAIGRALGNFGIGVDSAVASADEMLNSINNQNQPKPKTQQQQMMEWVDANPDVTKFLQDNYIMQKQATVIFTKTGPNKMLFIKECEKYIDSQLNKKADQLFTKPQ